MSKDKISLSLPQNFFLAIMNYYYYGNSAVYNSTKQFSFNNIDSNLMIFYSTAAVLLHFEIRFIFIGARIPIPENYC